MKEGFGGGGMDEKCRIRWSGLVESCEEREEKRGSVTVLLPISWTNAYGFRLSLREHDTSKQPIVNSMIDLAEVGFTFCISLWHNNHE